MMWYASFILSLNWMSNVYARMRLMLRYTRTNSSIQNMTHGLNLSNRQQRSSVSSFQRTLFRLFQLIHRKNAQFPDRPSYVNDRPWHTARVNCSCGKIVWEKMPMAKSTVGRLALQGGWVSALGSLDVGFLWLRLSPCRSPVGPLCFSRFASALRNLRNMYFSSYCSCLLQWQVAFWLTTKLANKSCWKFSCFCYGPTQSPVEQWLAFSDLLTGWKRSTKQLRVFCRKACAWSIMKRLRF